MRDVAKLAYPVSPIILNFMQSTAKGTSEKSQDNCKVGFSSLFIEYRNPPIVSGDFPPCRLWFDRLIMSGSGKTLQSFCEKSGELPDMVNAPNETSEPILQRDRAGGDDQAPPLPERGN